MSKIDQAKVGKILKQLEEKPGDIQVMELLQAYVPKSLVIIVSPHDDILGAYDNRVVNIKMKRNDGRRMKIIKALMTTKREGDTTYKSHIDNFLLVVDGIVWNLAKGRSRDKKKKLKTKH